MEDRLRQPDHLHPLNGFGLTVDWGDGSNSTGVSGTATHVYANPGAHTVSVYGGLKAISLEDSPDADKLVSVDQWGDTPWTTMGSAFRGAANMVYTATDVPDLSRVTDMSRMFSGATSFNGDIFAWDVSSVTDMKGMFWRASSFNQDISAWNTSSVNNMASMFSEASSFNGDIFAWDVSSVTTMIEMFSRAPSFN